MAFVPDNLDLLKYAGLQQLAKQCGVKANMKVSDVRSGRGYFAECGLRNSESCQWVICRKSSAERSANYPLSLFRIPQPKNSAFPRIAKLPFARIAQQMCNRCIAASGVPRSFPSVGLLARVKIPGTNWKQWLNAFQWVPGSI